jgi:hypothetical protein
MPVLIYRALVKTSAPHFTDIELWNLLFYPTLG